jgi:hypothetical protein
MAKKKEKEIVSKDRERLEMIWRAGLNKTHGLMH